EKFNYEELKKYIDIKGNWKLVSEVDHQALTRAYPNLEECLDFIQNYKKYLLAKNEIFSEIEKKLPTNRNHLLFSEIKEFKKKKFD
ncbi:9200_t:CDS:1, partial [Scutellospora calospora]